MPKVSILKELKEVVYSLYDTNGNERVTPIGVVSSNNLSVNRLELLKNICDLVLNTDIICKETKMYISNRNIKVAQINEEIVEQLISEYGEKGAKLLGLPSVNNTTSKIQYDKTRLERMLGADIITHVLYQKTVSIEAYQICVGKLLDKYNGVETLNDKLLLHIDDNVYSREYMGDFIEEFKDILSVYLVSRVKEVEKTLNSNKDFVGYYNFLLSGASCPNDKVKRDRKLLRQLLNGEDIAHELGNEREGLMDDSVEDVSNDKTDKAILNKALNTDKVESEEILRKDDKNVIPNEDKLGKNEDITNGVIPMSVNDPSGIDIDLDDIEINLGDKDDDGANKTIDVKAKAFSLEEDKDNDADCASVADDSIVNKSEEDNDDASANIERIKSSMKSTRIQF